MRTQTKTNIVMGAIVVTMISIVALLLVVMINDIFGDEQAYGEPFDYTYSYCAQTSYGPKAMTWCSQYKTGHELRQHTRIRGLWFDRESSRLVDNR